MLRRSGEDGIDFDRGLVESSIGIAGDPVRERRLGQR
jgi:hypothetical protein